MAFESVVCEALPADVLERHCGAVNVIEAELRAGIPAEVKFGHVALQMLFANVMEGADQTALEQRER